MFLWFIISLILRNIKCHSRILPLQLWFCYFQYYFITFGITNKTLLKITTWDRSCKHVYKIRSNSRKITSIWHKCVKIRKKITSIYCSKCRNCTKRYIRSLKKSNHCCNPIRTWRKKLQFWKGFLSMDKRKILPFSSVRIPLRMRKSRVTAQLVVFIWGSQIFSRTSEAGTKRNSSTSPSLLLGT